MFDIRGKNIRDKKLMIKYFFEVFQFILKCPSVRFDMQACDLGRILFTAVMILSLLRLAAYLSMVFTIDLEGSLEDFS